MECNICGHELKPLFSSLYCPNEEFHDDSLWSELRSLYNVSSLERCKTLLRRTGKMADLIEVGEAIPGYISLLHKPDMLPAWFSGKLTIAVSPHPSLPVDQIEEGHRKFLKDWGNVLGPHINLYVGQSPL